MTFNPCSLQLTLFFQQSSYTNLQAIDVAMHVTVYILRPHNNYLAHCKLIIRAESFSFLSQLMTMLKIIIMLFQLKSLFCQLVH